MHEAELTERLNELKTKVNALDDKLGIRQRKFDRAKAAKAAKSPRQGTQNTQNSARSNIQMIDTTETKRPRDKKLITNPRQHLDLP